MTGHAAAELSRQRTLASACYKVRAHHVITVGKLLLDNIMQILAFPPPS
jgi:hypothetical protein